MPSDASYYDDGPGDGAPAPAQKDEEADSGSKTALLPKSLFGHDLKVGDKCDVEICAVHEDDYEVKGCYGHDDDDKQKGDGTESPEPVSPMRSMIED